MTAVEESNFRFLGHIKYIHVNDDVIIASVPHFATEETCRQLIKICEICGFRNETKIDYVQATVDLEVDTCPAVKRWLLQRNLVAAVSSCILATHGVDIIGFDDVFVVKYDATSLSGQSELRLHVDGGDVSFMLALSHPCDYTGGGTYFELLENESCSVIHLDIGELLVFNAELYHAGVAITSGVRYLLVGFCVTHSIEDCNVSLNLERIK